MSDTAAATDGDMERLAEQFRRMGLPYLAPERGSPRGTVGSSVSAGRRAELLAMTEQGRRVLASEKSAG